MKNLILSIIVVLSSSFVSCQNEETLFLEKGTPAQVNVNSKLINDLISDIKTNKIKNIHSLLIIKDDKLIVEEYFGDFSQGRLQYTASVSKSFASTLLGIAIDKGFFGDDIQTVLNKNIAELFPKYADIIKKDPLKANLKLKHILSMTAGFEWDEHTFPYSDGRNDCIRINSSDDPMKFLFERKLIHQPGTEFYYNGGLSLSISYLIEKYTKMSVDDFAEEYLFNPLEITDYIWENVANGLIDTDGGLHLKPIDQAKLGYLFLNNGVWNKTQIVSKEWVQIASKMHHQIQDSPDYGLQWWGGDFNAFWKTFPTFMASGHGGQNILVFPDYDTIVVICQQVFNNDFGQFNNISILSRYILPALENIELKVLFPSNLNKFIGYYKSIESDDDIYITIKNDQLLATANDGSVIYLNNYGMNKFMGTALEILDVYFEFLPNQSNEINKLNASFGFRDGIFIKSNQ
jgi:CubicO group peptidase (beta-lactamase class C family)